MHFVTGGAFNGKRAWVKEKYPDVKWVSSYNKDPFVEDLAFFHSKVVVLEGLEEWIKEMMVEKEMNDFRSYWKKVLREWSRWENMDEGRQVIVIGTDITKGIVPMEKEIRSWRDLTGWAYQDLASVCNKVDVIWYGMNQTIKGEFS